MPADAPPFDRGRYGVTIRMSGLRVPSTPKRSYAKSRHITPADHWGRGLPYNRASDRNEWGAIAKRRDNAASAINDKNQHQGDPGPDANEFFERKIRNVQGPTPFCYLNKGSDPFFSVLLVSFRRILDPILLRLSNHWPMRPLSFFFAFFAAFFSFGVRAGTFLDSLLLFCSLLIIFPLFCVALARAIRFRRTFWIVIQASFRRTRPSPWESPSFWADRLLYGARLTRSSHESPA